MNEYDGLKKLYQSSPRNSKQLNSFNTSDTEIVQVKKDLFLVSSTDSLAVEIHSGLYQYPETWGYLAVANSVSDLAASGAKPIGMLVSAQWKKAHRGSAKNRVYKSMASALKKFEIPLLGGDSGSSEETVLTTTILGQSVTRPLTRLGVSEGDLAILFGDSLGYGPALAFDYLKNHAKNKWEMKFRPGPDWTILHQFKSHFKASIDSSDGVFNSLNTLGRLNKVSFTIDASKLKLSRLLNSFRRSFKIPIQYFVESDLGDLQTCAIIDPKKYDKIKSRLPAHQIIAVAEKKIHQKPNVSYAGISLGQKYLFLSDILEQNDFNYPLALNRWMKQFSK